MSFPRFTCVRCARRLSRVAQHCQPLSNPVLRRATTLSRKHQPLSVTHLFYSTASSRSMRAVATRDSFAKVRFTRADVPPREFWEQHARAPLVADLGADECLQTAQAYADAALKDAPGWRQRLIAADGGEGKTLSAYALHYVAVMIAMNSQGNAPHLATHILHTLTGLDYAPSILTLVRMALQRRRLDQPQFEPAVEGLERMLKRIGDGSGNKASSRRSKIDFAADACTLRALIYAAENTREGDNNALRWFRRAYEIGSALESDVQTTPTAADQVTQEQKQENEVDAGKDSEEGVEGAYFNPHWQWKVSFALGVASIRMKRGEIDKARDMYEVASSELNNATGYYEMANALEKMGKTDTEKYIESLQKAAVSGSQDAARKMGTREWGRAVEEGLSKWEKRKRQVVAEEWMAIAGVAAIGEA
ncbi:hypothetical protein HD806DRAFT_528185 [Xylariaceae sp. AK1471]|nr:hypothetical protein HD806DRAFT_528185 [Xylariaceae sp. AK1471]